MRIVLETGDAAALQFADDTFDAVRCERVLQWMEDPDAAVAELARVTSPGGTVVLLDTDWRTFSSTVDEPGLEQQMVGPWPTPHAGGFLRSYARRAGLVDVEAKAVVHHANGIAGDATDGMFPFDQYLELQVDGGVPREVAERYLQALARQSNSGDLTFAVTMWAVIGTVPTRGNPS